MAYVKLEDRYGRIVKVPVFNESEDGSGVWHVPVCDSNGYLKINLDISTLLENPPTEDEDEKAPTSEWAYDHAADYEKHNKVILKTADQTVTNSETHVNDTHLLLAIGANEVWLICFYLLTNSGTTPDIEYQIVCPSGATGEVTAHRRNEVPSPFNISANIASTGIASDMFADLLFVIVKNGTTAGNVQLTWAQNVQDNSDTKVLENSCLIATQLV